MLRRGNVMKRIIRGVFLPLSLLTATFLTSCWGSVDTTPSIESGTRIDLSTENYSSYLSLKFRELEAKKKGDVFTGIAYDVRTTGNAAFSYFNVQVELLVNCQCLLDSGVYSPVSFNFTVFTDQVGSGRKIDVNHFGNAMRNVKDVTAYVSRVDGYIVKK